MQLDGAKAMQEIVEAEHTTRGMCHFPTLLGCNGSKSTITEATTGLLYQLWMIDDTGLELRAEGCLLNAPKAVLKNDISVPNLFVLN
jgi:hypothetical protein